jgi:hypothetical protein
MVYYRYISFQTAKIFQQLEMLLVLSDLDFTEILAEAANSNATRDLVCWDVHFQFVRQMDTGRTCLPVLKIVCLSFMTNIILTNFCLVFSLLIVIIENLPTLQH